ncbi:MAG: hypothetical protein EX270_01170, partial [Pseudomonadales bacterium]
RATFDGLARRFPVCDRAWRALALLSASRRTLLAVFALSIVLQVATISLSWLMAEALAVEVPFSACLALVPLVWVLTMAPVSLGGIGVREAAFVYLFGLVGVPGPVSRSRIAAKGRNDAVAGDDKIEVMEIFWYGCGHCETFEPLLASWEKRAAEDVVLLRTPAVWQKSMRSHAALYYVAAALDAPHQLHTDLFALLVKNRALNDEKKFAEVFAKHGISEEKFGKLFKSFGITTKVNQGEKRLRKNYRAQGTPELIVNGKYRVGTRSAGGQAKMLEVVDFLIQQERKAALAAAA